MYSYFNRKNISINLIINTQKVKLTNIKIDCLKLALSISLIFLFALNLSNNYNSMYVFGHSIFGNNNNGNTTQIQTNGNYKVELFTNPSKIPLNKPVDILLNFSVISSNGLQMMELPVYLSLAKDGELGNLQHTPIIISGEHYNFKTVFPEAGKYLLFVDVKDIYYTNSKSFTFPDSFILVIGQIRLCFHLPYRQTEGIAQSHAKGKVLPSILDYTTTSRRINKLNRELKDEGNRK